MDQPHRDFTTEEIREFLMRWLMEFGTEPASWDRRAACEWYMDQLSEDFSAGEPETLPYLVHTDPDEYQLNQAGLDFIKGE